MKGKNIFYNSNQASTELKYFLGVVLSSLLILLLESYITYLFLIEEISLTTLVICHITICVILTLCCIALFYFKIDMRLYLHLLFMISVAATIGAAISFVTSIICWISFKHVDPEWLYKIGLEEDEEENEKLYYRLISSQEDFTEKGDIVPISEILEEGNATEQRLIIAKMARYFSPRFSKLLRQAVKSKENSIRVQAATVIANIESTFSKKLIELEKQFSEDKKNPDTVLMLAQHCDTYAYCGILTDPEKIEQFYLRAIEYYDLYQKLTSEKSDELSLTLARLNLRVNHNSEALEYLNQILNNEDDILTPRFFLWYVEVLYRLKKYAEINQFCLKYKDKIQGDAAAEEMAKSVIELWLEHHEA